MKQSDVIVQKQFILYKSVRVVVDMLAALTNHHHEKLLLDPAAARLSRQASFFSFFAAARVGFAFDCENVPHSEQRVSAKGGHQQILYSAPSLCGTFCLNTRTLHPCARQMCSHLFKRLCKSVTGWSVGRSSIEQTSS